MKQKSKRTAAPKKTRKAPPAERRFIASSGDTGLTVEYRDAGEGTEKTAVIRGTAIVFNSESRDLGGFREIIMPEALDKFFERNSNAPDVAALFNHDTGEVLGRTPDTLKLSRDDKGLHFELTPPKSRADVLESVARRDIRGASFAFTLAKGGDTWKEGDEGPIRTIREIDQLFEVSLVLQPAYEATSVTAAKRSMASWKRSRTAKKKASAEKESQRNDLVERLKSSASSLREYLQQRGSK